MPVTYGNNAARATLSSPHHHKTKAHARLIQLTLNAPS